MLLSDAREAVKDVTDKWWLFLVAGLAWFVISLLVLRMNLTSVAAVGVLLGIVFLVSGAEEVLVASVRTSWAWARYLLAACFFVGAVWCFIRPFGAFWSLAAALGFLLVFKGTLDIIESVSTQAVNPVWWLGLVAGILELGLGFWASQQYFPARAALLLLWVGLYALLRGISEIVLAFQVRSAG
jgi:uncharacterized membrane protein HdeD (DUF308 family)